MGRGPRITDAACKTGMVAFVTKTKRDWDHEPALRELDDELKRLEKRFNSQDPDLIRSSEALRTEASALLQQYGPVLWRRGGDRPWLFRPNEERARRLYKKDLYYDTPEHVLILQKALYELALLRTLRYRKDHLNDDPEASLSYRVSTERRSVTSDERRGSDRRARTSTMSYQFLSVEEEDEEDRQEESSLFTQAHSGDDSIPPNPYRRTSKNNEEAAFQAQSRSPETASTSAGPWTSLNGKRPLADRTAAYTKRTRLGSESDKMEDDEVEPAAADGNVLATPGAQTSANSYRVSSFLSAVHGASNNGGSKIATEAGSQRRSAGPPRSIMTEQQATSIRMLTRLKDSQLIHVMRPGDCETVDAFFTKVSVSGPFRSKVGSVEAIASITVGFDQPAITKEFWIGPGDHDGFEELLEEVAKQMRHDSVVLSAEVELAVAER